MFENLEMHFYRFSAFDKIVSYNKYFFKKKKKMQDKKIPVFC